MKKHISVKGVVQGVGFRPFVYGLATRLNLHGWVCNTSGGVEIVAQGQTSDIETFIHSIKTEAPALARIDDLTLYDDLSDVEYSSFEIQPSTSFEGAYHPIPADIAICPECERELFDPRNRRYLYPFINCANCGPRFTIIKDIPYDRQNTTMAEFEMCERCEQEFKDSQDRHFRAQPLACPECGPFVSLRDVHTPFLGSVSKVSSIEFRISAILRARRLLREGYILGIKGLGGFHLACDASNSLSVEELRDRKGRIEKPFALMAANMEVVRSICHVSQEEEALLTSREKPIILLEKNAQQGTLQQVSKWVAPYLDTIGVMLPYTPLHHVLLNQTDPVLGAEPVPSLLVMTSGNFSEEPISTDDEDALVHLSPLVDAFILHNRDIHMRCDDSVVRVAGRRSSADEHSDGKNQPPSTIYLRRSRGYSPYPVKLPFGISPTLAVGGKVKNTFCLARDQYAFLSHHIGDMESTGALESFEQGIEHLSHIFRVQPEIVAHDLHPDYASTRYAQHLNIPLRGVQHHHAHIVSCMVDNGLDDRRVVGLAFDGAGYGTDGMIWGGEVLLASFAHFERFAHLEYLPLPGHDPAMLTPWSIAVGYAHVLDIAIDDLHFLRSIDEHLISGARSQVDRSAHPQLTSSLGYLFDAVASLVGVRNHVTYEAQAAMELEVLARPLISIAKSYPYAIDEDGTIRLLGLLSSIVDDIRARKPIEIIAACFHKTVADVAIDICIRVRKSTGVNEVALSGGVWQNQILLSLVRDGLAQAGFVVYFHQQVPTNDGGLALGQAVIANCSLGTQEYSSAAMDGEPSDRGA